MPNSKSVLSYPLEQKEMDNALAAERGVVLTFESKRMRDAFLYRCFQFRQIVREQNKVLYPDPGNVMHGGSIYDILRVAKLGDKQVEIEKRVSVEYTSEPM